MFDLSDSSCNYTPTATPTEQSFLFDRPASPNETFSIFSLHPLVGGLLVTHLRDEVIADPLHLLECDLWLVQVAGQRDNGALGICAYDLAEWDTFPDFPSDACESATSPRT